MAPNLTLFLEDVELKFLPINVTVSPNFPMAGEKLEIIGGELPLLTNATTLPKT